MLMPYFTNQIVNSHCREYWPGIATEITQLNVGGATEEESGLNEL